MSCPNGHKGDIFCCADHVTQTFDRFYEKYKDYTPQGPPLIPVTLDQWEAYLKLLKEQDDE